MRTRASKLATAALLFLACSPGNRGPLSFEAPAGWTAQHKKSKGIHSYILAAPTILEGQLEFSEWSAPGKPEDMPVIIGRVTTSFLQQARATSAFRVASEEYRIEHFAGGQCQGDYTRFAMTGYNAPTLQTMFIMSVENKLWTGQFSGPADTWNQALAVLKSVKPND